MLARTIALLLLVLLSSCVSTVPQRLPPCDVWIRNGLLVDGSGSPGRAADVLIRGEEIVYVGEVPSNYAGATKSLDARGKVVTPGFIDTHAHGDPRRTPAFANFLRMGVTTICLGQDGQSPGQMDLQHWMQQVERGKHAPNIAAMIGHGTVRKLAAVGFDPEPTEAQLQAMQDLVDEAMQVGAFGLSTGLEYEPGRFANATELLCIAQPVARHGGLVMSHLRSEDEDRIAAAIDELLTQCRQTGCAAHVSHLKIVYANGPQRTEQVLAMLAEARDRGQQVTADIYPYIASYTGVGIVFPDWARPPHDYQTAMRQRRPELVQFLRDRVTRRNGPDALVLGSGPFEGMTLAAIATQLGKRFEDVLIDDIGPDGPGAAHFVMDREIMRRLLLAPHVMIASDGSPTMRHPRGHGTFARVIREFVRERADLDLETAVHKMTGLPAATLGLDRCQPPRGLLHVGHAADVLIFDPDQVHDAATFEAPFESARGFDQVMVNGSFVVDDGKLTERRPGRLLRHVSAAAR